MKKLLVKSLIATFLAIIFVPAIAHAAHADVQIRIDGRYINADVGHVQIVNGRTLACADVFWDIFRISFTRNEAAQSYEIRGIARFYTSITMGYHTLSVLHPPTGWAYFPLDVPARYMNGTAMYPLRAIAEGFGFIVDWDCDARRIDISSLSRLMPWQHPVVRPDYWPDHLPYHHPGDIHIAPENQFTSLVSPNAFPLQFRLVWYGIHVEFLELVSDEDRLIGDSWDYPPVRYGYVLPLMRFVQVHNISREDFDTVLNMMIEGHASIAARGIIDINCEWHELPNADIIFTFDNDLIRWFYRRE
jgi:hypothetical protein